MLCKNYALFVLVNKHRKRRGLRPLSRRRFCKIAAASSATLAIPCFWGCESSSPDNAHIDASTGIVGQSGMGGITAQGESGGIVTRDAAQDGNAPIGPKTDAGSEAGTTVPYDEYEYPDDTDMTIAPQEGIDYHRYTPGMDTRAEIKIDPNIELDDYSGPFRPNLRFTDFSRKQLGRMYSMAHHYHYRIQRAYRRYIHDTWGNDAVGDSEEKIWGELTVDELHELYRDVMKITADNLESFMKSWQLDLNSQPGDFWEIVFEMPTSERGLVTVNRCPVVDEYEKRGSTAGELLAVCKKKCHSAIQSKAKLYHPNIELKVLATPPRASTDNICCRFAVRYHGDDFQDAATPDLNIDPTKQDLRADTTINPNVTLEDYSGPFRPDLRMTNFSREQLARMFLMCHKHDLGMMIGYQEWAMLAYGWKEMVVMPVEVWANYLFSDAYEVATRFMNITEQSIASYLKALQVDITAQPPNFDNSFEMPSPDRGIYTFNVCFGETNLRNQGAPPDKVLEFCEMDPPAIRKCAKLYHPDIRVKIMALPPVLHPYQVACKWDMVYQK